MSTPTVTGPFRTADLAEQFGMYATSTPHPDPAGRARELGEHIGDSSHFLVTLHRPDRDAAGNYVPRRLVVDYSRTGVDVETGSFFPTLGEVLQCATREAGLALYAYPGDWQGWARRLGFDLSDPQQERDALALHERVMRRARAFVAWLPEGVDLDDLDV